MMDLMFLLLLAVILIFMKKQREVCRYDEAETVVAKGDCACPAFLLLVGLLAGCGGKPQKDVSSADGPANTYTPPVNEASYIVITMPIVLIGGNTAEELETEHKEAMGNCLLTRSNLNIH